VAYEVATYLQEELLSPEYLQFSTGTYKTNTEGTVSFPGFSTLATRNPNTVTFYKYSVPQVIERGEAYRGLWADVTDNLDSDIEEKLVIDASTVNTAKAGPTP